MGFILQKDIKYALLEVSEKLNSEKDLDKLLSGIANAARQFIAADSITIMLEEDNDLVMRAYSGAEPPDRRISIGAGIAGGTAKTGKEFISPSFLCIPLAIDLKLAGVISFAVRQGKRFDDSDIAVAEFVTSMAAVVLDRHILRSQKHSRDNLQLVGMFRSSVAHDMANILGVAEVYLELLEKEVTKTPEIDEYFSDLYAELQHVGALASDMLDFSKERLRVNKSLIKVSTLVDELKRHNRFLTNNTDINIEYRLEKDFEINIDKGRFFRVLFNLVNNAVDALDGKGRIVLKIKKCGNFVYFMVADNGKGIRKENLRMLFAPFFTFGKVNGNGLGLAVVDEIVKAHGGTVRVRSEENRYTCFVVKIPVGE